MLDPCDLDFNDDEIIRYSRHILLAEVGGTGQAKLRAAQRAGGRRWRPRQPAGALSRRGRRRHGIGVVDDDVVELSNLQRQIAHTTGRIGAAKVAVRRDGRAARSTLMCGWRRIASGSRRTTPWRWSADYDIVCDGTDNFATRFLIADACVLARRTLVSAAVLRFEGQLSVFRPHAGGPCYRCLYPEPPPPGMVPACSEAGVLGAVTGVMGTLQATEVLKEILGIGETLAGRLLIWDALATRFRTVRLHPDPHCAACGPDATLHDLSAHSSSEGFTCGI